MTNFPTKISVNLPVEGHLLDYVKRQNAKIVAAGSRDISFQNQNQIAHITLLMGDVKTESDFKKLLAIVNDVSKRYSKFLYQVSLPYPAQPGGKFCFIGIHHCDQLLKFRFDLSRQIGNLMDTGYHGGPDNPAHITIGYFDATQSDLNRFKFETFLDCAEASKIGLSLVGNRGTCTEYLKLYEL